MSLEQRPNSSAVHGGGCAKLSTGCKCCIGCGVCSAVTAAILIPIGIFVIGPHVAQSVLDKTEISLPNLTQAACETPNVWLFNSAKIKVPGIGPVNMASHLESYKQETWTTGCMQGDPPVLMPGAVCGENATEYQMGSYSSPSMTVSPGENYQNFTVVMNAKVAQFNVTYNHSKVAQNTILDAWVSPLWFSGQKARLILKAKDVKVKVGGITFSGLTMRNELVCTGVSTTQITIPQNVCYPNDHKDPGNKTYTAPGFHAICEAGKGSIAPTTTVTTTPLTTTTTPKKLAQVIA